MYANHLFAIEFLLATAVGIFICLFTGDIERAQWSDIYGLLSNLFMFQLGFSAATYAMMLSFMDKRRQLVPVFEARSLRDIRALHESAIRWSWWGLMVSLVLVFFGNKLLCVETVCHYVIVLSSAWAMVRFQGCCWLLLKMGGAMIKTIEREPNRPGSLVTAMPIRPVRERVTAEDYGD